MIRTSKDVSFDLSSGSSETTASLSSVLICDTCNMDRLSTDDFRQIFIEITGKNICAYCGGLRENIESGSGVHKFDLGKMLHFRRLGEESPNLKGKVNQSITALFERI